MTIGLLDGAARGGGCEFLSALDLRMGSPRSVIGQPEVAMGILPGAGGTARWPRLVGRARALDILLSGRDVEAQEALEIGWLDWLVPVADLEAAGTALAERIARMPRASIAAVKRVVDVSLSSLQPALVAESDALADLLSQGLQQAPMRAFLAAGGQTREGETQPDAAPSRRDVGPPESGLKARSAAAIQGQYSANGDGDTCGARHDREPSATDRP